jgi:hypothetical protein
VRVPTPAAVCVALLLPLTLSFSASAAGAPTVAGPASSSVVDSTELFAEVTGYAIPRGDSKVRVRPTSFSAYDVDLAGLRSSLGEATTSRSTTISLPDPSGRPVDFEVTEDSVLQRELQAAHPEIRTYAGRAVDGSGRSARLDITPMGFHAFVRGPGGRSSWFVDPVSNRRGERRHVSYFGSALPADKPNFVERDLLEEADAGATANFATTPGGVVSRRTFRLAFVTDPTYAQYFAPGADEATSNAVVLAEKTTLINRVNEVYNDDLAIKFELINGTDTKLNLNTVAEASNPNGPCGQNPCIDKDAYQSDGTANDAPDGCGAVLDRNTFVLGQLVGAQNFDIGHIGIGVNGGGVAGLGVVGGYSKARGCTGLPQPDGDFYAVDYVAHEMGHQMGGNHTFNGTQVNCSTGNRNVDPYTTQVEPGSGSSVMAYAGICGQDNLQPHSDPYFSFVSIEEIEATTADDTSVVDERQVVTFTDPDGPGTDTGFDSGEAVTLSCAGCPGSPVTITNDPAYSTGLTVANAVGTLTGFTPLVGDYDMEDPLFGLPSGSPSNKGFTLEWAVDGTGEDIPHIQVAPAVGTAPGFVGVTRQGGETTNEGAVAATANHAPTVTAPADKTIPIQTPFTLTGSGADADGNSLTYLWEQTDPGGVTGTGLVDNAKAEGPLFRMFGRYAPVSKADSLQYHSPGENLADGNPSRTFPDMTQVLADNTNAETGACPDAPPPPASGGATNVPVPIIECYSEFLPTATYADSPTGGELNFRLTGRDQFATGGGIAVDDVTLTLDSSAGPFLVTSRSASGTAATPGGTEAVTWDVAGTNSATFATNVKISLSTDGGKTFPTVLAASTPNDGIEAVTLPSTQTNHARIKVEAVGNYFFDVNDADFNIGIPDTSITSGPRKGSFVLKKKTTFKLASTIPDSTFECTLDGKHVPCTDTVTFKPSAGTHRFTARALGSVGIKDPTPVTRTFAAPYDDTKLKRQTRGWERHQTRGSYKHTWTEADAKGEILKLAAERIKKLALVAQTGPDFGRVAIFVGKDRVETIDLARGKTLHKKVLLKISSFKKPLTGTIRIVTLDNKPVRIDGLGVMTRRP